jgi:ABC-type transporter Mla maintaining outer membrane lipid asymmetry permease subunit MlaE
VARLSGQTFAPPWRRLRAAELSKQIVQIGLRSTTIVLLTSVFSAMVITVQFALQLARFGRQGLGRAAWWA